MEEEACSTSNSYGGLQVRGRDPDSVLSTSPTHERFSPETVTKIILSTPPPVTTHQRKVDLARHNQYLDRDYDRTGQYTEGKYTASRRVYSSVGGVRAIKGKYG